MSLRSAGILLYRRRAGEIEILLVHPGGPYWAKKDHGAWSVPKGQIDPGEDDLLAAKREFREETGLNLEGAFSSLGTFHLPSDKQLTLWTMEGDCDPSQLVSNTFEMIWPPHSNKRRRFAEVDRGGWFGRACALKKIVKGQRPAVKGFFDRYA